MNISALFIIPFVFINLSYGNENEKIDDPHKNERDALIAMFDIDQNMIISGVNPDITLEIQNAHVSKLKSIIESIGWPDKNKVGEKASKGAFIIAQHADFDINFQKQALELMGISLRKQAVQAKYFAYLADRVARNHSDKQLYGTQGRCVGRWKWMPWDINYPETVDVRRHMFGLNQMSDYIEILNRSCGDYKNQEQ